MVIRCQSFTVHLLELSVVIRCQSFTVHILELSVVIPCYLLDPLRVNHILELWLFVVNPSLCQLFVVNLSLFTFWSCQWLFVVNPSLFTVHLLELSVVIHC